MNIIVPNESESPLWLPPSARTSKNDPRFRPWRCKLMVQTNSQGDMEPAMYYVRAGNPQAACMMAERYWTQWEKKDIGLGRQQYPDVLEIGYAEVIDESDWDASWKEVQKYEFAFRAVEDEDEPGFPMLFTVIGKTDV